MAILQQSEKTTRKYVVAVVSVLLFSVFCMELSWARNLENDERRQQVGLTFFPNIIAVDEDILDKRTPSGMVTLLFVYSVNREQAELLAGKFSRKVRTIKRSPVTVVVTDDPGLTDRPGGIFLTEWLPSRQFEQVMNFAIARNVIVFSPFVGDVERGATAGLNISTKIRPSLNLTTLKKSKIRINDVFKRLSKHYE